MNREMGWPLAAVLSAFFLAVGEQSGLFPSSWWLVPWVLSLLLFGLPHGAIDHEVVLALWKPGPPPRWALGVTLVGYLAVTFVVILCWFISPVAVFLGFILLTWAHWGLADLWWSWRRDPSYFAGRVHRVVFVLWRGSLPMLVPLAVDPLFYRRTAEVTCALFLERQPAFPWLTSGAVRYGFLGLACLLGLADAFLARKGSKTRWLNLSEGAALLAFFGVLPALVSVGLYFSFWHGLRHVSRLCESRGLTPSGFARHAIPATLGALVLLGSLAFILRHRMEPARALGVYLALIAALTVPHAAVVTFLDLADGLWKPERSRDGSR